MGEIEVTYVVEGQEGRLLWGRSSSRKQRESGHAWRSEKGHMRTNQAGGDKYLRCTTTAQFSLLESWPSIR